MTAAYEAWPRRLQSPDSSNITRAPAAGTGRCAAATPIPSSARDPARAFDEGLYLNPGPWRIPYHHHALRTIAAGSAVTLEPFMQLNHNAFLHSAKAFGGKPQRIREVKADFEGGIAELLARRRVKARSTRPYRGKIRKSCSRLCALMAGLDADFRYKAGDESAISAATPGTRAAASAPSR